jgi:hypothetical protein
MFEVKAVMKGVSTNYPFKKKPSEEKEKETVH